MNIILEMIRKPKLILLVLDRLNILRLSDKKYLELFFELKMKNKLNLNNPKTFNEKLQYMKLYNKNPKYTELVDKYKVKEYVSEIIGKEHIIPTLGLYNSFEEIDFKKLPNQFVLKCTHDSGGVYICKDKDKIQMRKLKKKIKESLKRNFFYYGREWPYKDVEPRIIAEKFMTNEDKSDLIDYKFFCFNGIPKFIYISRGLENHKTANIDFLDMDYNKVEFYRNDYKRFDILPPKPKNFEKMKKISEELSKGFPFLRVDLYEINSDIYFSELTFFPCSGFMPITPNKWDYKIGEWIDLKKINGELNNDKKDKRKNK